MIGTNFAVTVLDAAMVTLQVIADDVVQPVQLSKLWLASGNAVKVIDAPC